MHLNCRKTNIIFNVLQLKSQSSGSEHSDITFQVALVRLSGVYTRYDNMTMRSNNILEKNNKEEERY